MTTMLISDTRLMMLQNSSATIDIQAEAIVLLIILRSNPSPTNILCTLQITCISIAIYF